MHADLSPLIAATSQWLTRAFPAPGGAFSAALAEAQIRQAVTVAAWLRYPTPMDAALVVLAGPAGSARLDRLTGADGHPGPDGADNAWRSWVDEVVASWAVCLLSEPGLAEAVLDALTGTAHTAAGPAEFRRLVAPDADDLAAAALVRHPDLVEPVASLHHPVLLDTLSLGPATAH